MPDYTFYAFFGHMAAGYTTGLHYNYCDFLVGFGTAIFARFASGNYGFVLDMNQRAQVDLFFTELDATGTHGTLDSVAPLVDSFLDMSNAGGTATIHIDF